MITKDNMIRLLSRFRDLCLNLYQEDIYPVKREDRDDKLGISSWNDTLFFIAGLRKEPIENIYQLVKTPRLIKQIMRRTYRTWESLHGEIDFDNLLVANVIRFGAPEAFNFILNNIREIRGLQSASDEILQARIKAIETEWSLMIENIEWDSTSAKELIKFLFPCWREKNSSFNKEAFIQSVQIKTPTDYWIRFLFEELGENEVHDQETIQSIIKWKQDPAGIHFHDMPLAEVLCKDLDFSSKFEYFAALTLDGYDIRSIASGVFTYAVKMHGVQAGKEIIPGFLPLWRQST
jgi:hypothetical protein